MTTEYIVSKIGIKFLLKFIFYPLVSFILFVIKRPIFPILVSLIVFSFISIYVVLLQHDLLNLKQLLNLELRMAKFAPTEVEAQKLFIINAVSILYYSTFFILVAVFYYYCPILNTKIVFGIIKKVDLNGWPLGHLFNPKVLINDEEKIEKTNLTSYIGILWKLARKHMTLLEELNEIIKLPLENLANVYIAEVRSEEKHRGNVVDNVALVRIRSGSSSSDNKLLSSGSLVYEGLSFDKNEEVFYWQTTPLCIDLFSLPFQKINGGESVAKSNLLFKTTKGKIVKFKLDQLPGFHSETIENFGDIHVPRDLCPTDRTSPPIIGFFTDIVSEENGETKISKKKATMELLTNQINRSKIFPKDKLAEATGKALLDEARYFLNIYSNEEGLAAQKNTHIRESNEFLKNFKIFIGNSSFWKDDGIFLKFLEK